MSWCWSSSNLLSSGGNGTIEIDVKKLLLLLLISSEIIGEVLLLVSRLLVHELAPILEQLLSLDIFPESGADRGLPLWHIVVVGIILRPLVGLQREQLILIVAIMMMMIKLLGMLITILFLHWQ